MATKSTLNMAKETWRAIQQEAKSARSTYVYNLALIMSNQIRIL